MSIQQKVLCTYAPSYLRATAWEASHDFKDGYRWFGNKLASHLLEMVENDLEVDEGEDEAELTDAILDFIAEATDDEIWKWLRTAMPKCMALVPPRRKDTFMLGFNEVLEDEGVLTTYPVQKHAAPQSSC